MKIQLKLTLGVGLLFVLIIFQSAVGIVYINTLKNDTKNILVANYNTLQYARNMMLALDKIQEQENALDEFESNLKKQTSNLTEIGEREATYELQKDFFRFKSLPSEEAITLLPKIRTDISVIMELNMKAIERKSTIANKTASSATIWIIVTGTACFLIAFTLLVNLPKNISNPIKELTRSIAQIAEQNYHERVHFESHNEFGEVAKSFNKMAKKLEEYNNSNLYKLLLENKRIETLINNLKDPVLGIDETQTILFINDEASFIFGFNTQEIIGKSALEVALHNDLMRTLIQDLNAPEKNTKKAPLKIYAHQKESFFEKEIIPIDILPTGEEKVIHIGHFIVLKNITSFKELEFAKTNFIATVSHELKTPISSIKMSLNLLENKQIGDINNDQKQLINSIHEDSDRLLKITGELLELSKLETGNIEYHIAPCLPETIVSVAANAVKTACEHQQIRLEITQNVQNILLFADSEKTSWILINLLTNAIRYSPENGTVHIAVYESDHHIHFAVADNGQGISEKYLDKIFDRYFQIPGSSKKGTGLGLSICKEMIEAQNGSIRVKSTIGIGSEFTFSLPEYIPEDRAS